MFPHFLLISKSRKLWRIKSINLGTRNKTTILEINFLVPVFLSCPFNPGSCVKVSKSNFPDLGKLYLAGN